MTTLKVYELTVCKDPSPNWPTICRVWLWR